MPFIVCEAAGSGCLFYLILFLGNSRGLFAAARRSKKKREAFNLGFFVVAVAVDGFSRPIRKRFTSFRFRVCGGEGT